MPSPHREVRASLSRRRLLTIPAVLGLALLALVTAPLWLTLLLLLDAVRRRRMASLRMGLFAGFYLACETAGLLAAFALWLRRHATGEDEALYRARNFRLQRWWAGALFAAARRIYRLELRVEQEGDPFRGPMLLFLRHASLGDTLLGSQVFSIPHGIELRYVLKSELLWDPCLDVVGHRLPNTFVRRDGEDSKREIEAVAALARDLGPDEGVLIYPEGTRFTEDKRRRVIARLEERDDGRLLAHARRLRAVLPPRHGGPLALMEAAPDVDVVLCMHHGFEAAGTAGDLWSGRLIGSRIDVRCVRYPAGTIPEDRAGWLLDRWLEVDTFVMGHQEAS